MQPVWRMALKTAVYFQWRRRWLMPNDQQLQLGDLLQQLSLLQPSNRHPTSVSILKSSHLCRKPPPFSRCHLLLSHRRRLNPAKVCHRPCSGCRDFDLSAAANALLQRNCVTMQGTCLLGIFARVCFSSVAVRAGFGWVRFNVPPNTL